MSLSFYQLGMKIQKEVNNPSGINIYVAIQKSIKAGLFFILLFLLACTSNTKKKNINDKLEFAMVDDHSIANQNNKINYKIPTPMELFIFMNQNETPYLSDILHKPLKYKEYFTNYKKGINFGIYTTDLAYATIYGNNQDAILYFKSAKELATTLGLYEGYGQLIAGRINNNIQNVDSLVEIANDSYNQSITFLENQGSTELLSLILVGSWIEALYISTQSIAVFDINNPIIERIADQQILLENLLSFLESQNQTSNMNSLIVSLKELQEDYDALYFNNEETIITADQFVKITNQVSDIRRSFINITP